MKPLKSYCFRDRLLNRSALNWCRISVPAFTFLGPTNRSRADGAPPRSKIPDNRLTRSSEEGAKSEKHPVPTRRFWWRSTATNVIASKKEETRIPTSQRFSRAFKSVASQSGENHPTLEVHIHVTGKDARFPHNAAAYSGLRCGEGACSTDLLKLADDRARRTAAVSAFAVSCDPAFGAVGLTPGQKSI